MQKSKKLKRQTLQSPMPTNWLEYINDDNLRLAIPVGPRFQAEIPDWTGPLQKVYPHGGDSDSYSSRWLGTKVWPIEGGDTETKGDDAIGKGRPDFCTCASPASIECVKRHVTYKMIRLQFDLGSAFWRWKFDEMGEEGCKLWNLEEEKIFDSLVKMNPISQGKSFLKPALDRLFYKRKESIVRYYFNVYVPRRISMKTRSGCKVIDTDDEEDGETPYSKGSRKRCIADSIPSYTAKYVKNRYLTGRR